MPKANNSKKTASALSVKLLLAALVVGLSALALSGYRFQTNQATCLYPPTDASLCLRLERATSPQQRQQGLSGRVSLAQNAGMLFVFPQAGTHCFWMKDMRFSLDIIWTNSQKRVVYLQQNLSPNTYPQTFCPAKPAQYVIELNAGSAQQYQLQVGRQLVF